MVKWSELIDLLLCQRIDILETPVGSPTSTLHPFEELSSIDSRSFVSVDVSKMSGWEKRLEKAKRKHRPKLRDWTKDGFARRRAGVFEGLRGEPASTGAIDRVHCSELSLEAFIQCYERPEIPVIIQGIPEAEYWKTAENWTLEMLRKRYGENRFKCGEDDDGYSVKVRLKHFLEYQTYQEDDSPLYIFDSSFDSNHETQPILTDYRVPSYFPDDLFELVGEKKRPPYRWFLVGPKRSGTSVHIDPLGTSAWNTVISGIKRWVLFPPDTPKHIAKGKHVIKDDEDDEPINYFVDLLPRMRKDVNLRAIEFLQYPGETVYVPCNWWHAVLNLTDTIAVTQNFCSRQNFDGVWRKARTGRKGMSRRWFRCLAEKYPDLALRATALNEQDGFEFDAYKNQSRKEKERERREEKKQRGKHYRNSSRSRSRSRSGSMSSFSNSRTRSRSYSSDKKYQRRVSERREERKSSRSRNADRKDGLSEEVCSSHRRSRSPNGLDLPRRSRMGGYHRSRSYSDNWDRNQQRDFRKLTRSRSRSRSQGCQSEGSYRNQFGRSDNSFYHNQSLRKPRRVDRSSLQAVN